CTERGKSFNRSAHLLRHRRIHAGERPYPCPKCGKTFTCNSHLNSHQKYGRKTPSRPDDIPYICSERGQRFSARSNLFRHQRIHTGEKKPNPINVPNAGKSFGQSSALIQHRRTH
ncbi:Zinc finger and SCAN domain-containing protein 2, partial [Eudyptes moseleyi]